MPEVLKMTFPGENRSILVLDSDSDSLSFIRNNLKKVGYEILAASTATDAMNILAQSPVDLVVADVNHISDNGTNLREILEDDPDRRELPFLFITDDDQARCENQLRGLRTGVEDCLQKPFDPLALVAYVQAAVTRYEVVRESMRRDGLTGLLNRQHLEHHIKKELYRLKRYDGVGSLITLELDGLDEINNQYGQRTGDLAVVHLSYILGSSTRATDIVGRLGGGGFLLYFPETKLENALKTVKKLQEKLEKADVADINDKLTFSAGVVEAFRHGEDYMKLFENANKALGKARENGKATVQGWDA